MTASCRRFETRSASFPGSLTCVAPRTRSGIEGLGPVGIGVCLADPPSYARCPARKPSRQVGPQRKRGPSSSHRTSRARSVSTGLPQAGQGRISDCGRAGSIVKAPTGNRQAVKDAVRVGAEVR